MRQHLLVLSILCLIGGVSVPEVFAQCKGNLIFSDEFNGSSLDQSKWSYETGNGCPGLCGWGNGEREYYTNSAQNVSVSGGFLNITARHQPNFQGSGADFTSGKINTRGKFDRVYGRFEARMKLPVGRGIWPAFWMLPTHNEYGGWPTSGEIDIMEYRGYEINKYDATLHYGNQWPANLWDNSNYTLPSGNFADSFHEFAVEWAPGVLRFYVDNILVKTETENPNSLSPASNNAVKWPWNKQFYMIINLAIGGNYIGAPSTAEILNGGSFPQNMQVDYVRVYDMSASGGQTPYLGTVRNIPGKIEAEHYNEGCSGIAYNDADASNNGGQFRTDGVDIETTTDNGAGYNVGYTNPGEWLNYNVNVVTAGSYDVQLRVATTATGKRVRVEMNGTSLGIAALPNTTGWQNWQTVTISNVNLTAGQKTMRVFFETDGINLNHITFVARTPVNQAPSVSLTSPASGASYTAPASIVINANASDPDGTVSKVDFYNGTTLLGTDTSSPYSFTWSNVAAGSYTITARVTDNGSLTTTSAAVTITVTNPVTQSPYTGSPIPLPGKIEAENFDLGGQGIAYHDVDVVNSGGAYRSSEGVDIEANNDGGAGYNVGWTAAGEWLEYTVNVATAGTYSAQFRIASTATGKSMHIERNGQNITGVVSIPNTNGWTTWQTVTISNITMTQGQQVLRVVFDTDGINLNHVVFNSSTPVNQLPNVSITSPVSNTSFIAPATITINANASDPDGTVSKVEFYNGATLLNTDTSSPYSFAWANVAVGTYTITARATDNAGAVRTSTAVVVSVTSSNPVNQLPTVSLTSPSNNASFNAPASITISATASDADGSVTKVEFYNGATLLNSDASSPYSFIWSNVAAGTYTITARATDNLGATRTSSAVTVVVNTVVTNTCSSIAQYAENSGYVAGSKVKNAGNQYECKPFPYSGWCNGAAWAYGPGTGVYWTDAWTLVGSCNARTLGSEDIATVNETLMTNAPNPFVGNTNIDIVVTEAGHVALKVYDKTGQWLSTLVDAHLNAGTYTYPFNASTLKADLYIVKMNTNNQVITRKILKTE